MDIQSALQETTVPSLVTFEERPMEDREATVRLGVMQYRSVIWAKVMPIGGRDVFEKPAIAWLEDQRKAVQEGRIPPNVLRIYENMYQAFQEGREAPLEGTDLRNWPLISPAQLKNCQSLRLRTVEQLAQLESSAIQRLGMGAQTLVLRAQEFLRTAQTGGKDAAETVALKEEISRLEAELAHAREEKQQLLQKIAMLEMRSGASSDAPAETGEADLLAEELGLNDPPANISSKFQMKGK